VRRAGDVATVGLLGASVASALGAIIIAMAFLPEDPPAFSTVLSSSSVACFVAALWSLRQRRLAWRTFFAVLRGVAVAAAIYAGFGILVILRSALTGPQLVGAVTVVVLLTVEIPALIAFSVARHQPAD
jgi:hypothetical protein